MPIHPTPCCGDGRPLIGWTGLALATVAGAAFAGGEDAVEGVQRTIRATAGISLLLFLAAYTASALDRWGVSSLRRNRRWLGLSFALSHGVHGGAVVAFAVMDPAGFDQRVTVATLVVGGAAYLLILAMVLTTWDGAAARRIGARRRASLHALGMRYLWLVFAVTYGKQTMTEPLAWGAVVLLGVGLALRIAAKRRAAV